jgi:hypothetical protein
VVTEKKVSLCLESLSGKVKKETVPYKEFKELVDTLDSETESFKLKRLFLLTAKENPDILL